ncbi:DNA polymerase zeta catalytic subunit [Plakobranchus ocellatus]|uniref:DNA polymerase zeta catalytic subunit n=1 Tax=Plakobranchus ocellatus TaxID=259542 RepID=A0AAV4APQ5_9GAST|nr:DNA polymerase zeta catalytic subunit [Plakobranchus ocellatus]
MEGYVVEKNNSPTYFRVPFNQELTWKNQADECLRKGAQISPENLAGSKRTFIKKNILRTTYQRYVSEYELHSREQLLKQRKEEKEEQQPEEREEQRQEEREEQRQKEREEQRQWEREEQRQGEREEQRQKEREEQRQEEREEQRQEEREEQRQEEREEQGQEEREEQRQEEREEQRQKEREEQRQEEREEQRAAVGGDDEYKEAGQETDEQKRPINLENYRDEKKEGKCLRRTEDKKNRRRSRGRICRRIVKRRSGKRRTPVTASSLYAALTSDSNPLADLNFHALMISAPVYVRAS